MFKATDFDKLFIINIKLVVMDQSRYLGVRIIDFAPFLKRNEEERQKVGGDG